MGFFNWWKTFTGYKDEYTNIEKGSINVIQDAKKLVVYDKNFNFIDRKPQYLIVDKMVDRNTAWLPIESKAQKNLQWIVSSHTVVYKTICIFLWNPDYDEFRESARDPAYANVNITVTKTSTKYIFNIPDGYEATPVAYTKNHKPFVWDNSKSYIIKIGIRWDIPAGGCNVLIHNKFGCYDYLYYCGYAITQSGNKICYGDTIEWNMLIPHQLKQNPVKYIRYVSNLTHKKYHLYYKNNKSVRTPCVNLLEFEWGDPDKSLTGSKGKYSIRYTAQWKELRINDAEIDTYLTNFFDTNYCGRWQDFLSNMRTSLAVRGTSRRFIRSTDDLENNSHDYIIKKQIRINYIDFKVCPRKYDQTKPVEDKYSYRFRLWFTYNQKTGILKEWIELK